jgi:MFS family permease
MDGTTLRLLWIRLTGLMGGKRRTRSIAETNTRLLYADIAWFGVFNAVAASFLSVFIARLGASPLLLSAVTSGPALMNILTQLPIARFVERNGNPRALTFWAGLTHRLGFLLIALLPLFLPREWQAYAVVTIVLLQGIPISVIGVAFSSMFADLVPRERLAHVVGTRVALLGVTSTITVAVSGVVLTILPFPLGYQELFLLAFVGSMGSLWTVQALHMPKTTHQAPQTPGNASATATSLGKDRNFARFATSSAALHLGMFMSAPLFPLYWVDTLHLSDAWISAFATIVTLTSILGSVGLRTVIHRWDARRLLAVSNVLFAFHPILTSLVSNPVLLALVTGFGGIWAGSIGVLLFSALTEVCPPHLRPRYIGVYTWLMNMAVFAAPLIGAGLADVLGIQTALVCAGLARLLAGMLFFRLPFAAWDKVYGVADRG